MSKSERRWPAAARGCKDVGKMRGTDDLIMGRSGEQGQGGKDAPLIFRAKGSLGGGGREARGLRANATAVCFFFFSHCFFLLVKQRSLIFFFSSIFFFYTYLSHLLSLSISVLPQKRSSWRMTTMRTTTTVLDSQPHSSHTHRQCRDKMSNIQT